MAAKEKTIANKTSDQFTSISNQKFEFQVQFSNQNEIQSINNPDKVLKPKTERWVLKEKRENGEEKRSKKKDIFFFHKGVKRSYEKERGIVRFTRG